MTPITFWYDPISPYAYLAFEQLPQALEGCSVVVDYRPVLFGALLQHHGHKGPAEIEPKRAWTFRQVAWQAHQLGLPLAVPEQHPFNPLALQRLALACAAPGGLPNRWVVETIFRHVWQGQGADANAPDRLAALVDTLKPQRAAHSAEVKAELRAHTEAAIARGLFGVPTFECAGRLFWGVDALPMLRAQILGEAWFAGPAWDEAGAPRAGVQRRP